MITFIWWSRCEWTNGCVTVIMSSAVCMWVSRFNILHSLPKSRIVKFLFFTSSFGGLKANCCPADGRSWSFALKVCITCWKIKKNIQVVEVKHTQLLPCMYFLSAKVDCLCVKFLVLIEIEALLVKLFTQKMWNYSPSTTCVSTNPEVAARSGCNKAVNCLSVVLDTAAEHKIDGLLKFPQAVWWIMLIETAGARSAAMKRNH